MCFLLEKLALHLRVHKLPDVLKSIHFTSSYFPNSEITVNFLDLSFGPLGVVILIVSDLIVIFLQVINCSLIPESHRLVHSITCDVIIIVIIFHGRLTVGPTACQGRAIEVNSCSASTKLSLSLIHSLAMIYCLMPLRCISSELLCASA